MQLTGEHFSPSSKNKKIHPEKISYTLILKKFLHFLKRNLFLYFREWKPRKNFSSENKIDPTRENFCYSNIKKFLILSQKKSLYIFQEKETPKKFFIFQETELSYISGNFLYFKKQLSKFEK